MLIKVKDFTITPGGRYKNSGDYSGEEFRESILAPNYLAAKNNSEKLIIDLDGTYGYPSSFLEEAFGGLARKYQNDNLFEIITLKSDEDPEEINRIKKYVKEANN